MVAVDVHWHKNQIVIRKSSFEKDSFFEIFGQNSKKISVEKKHALLLVFFIDFKPQKIEIGVDNFVTYKTVVAQHFVQVLIPQIKIRETWFVVATRSKRFLCIRQVKIGFLLVCQRKIMAADFAHDANLANLFREWKDTTEREGVFIHSVNHECNQCDLRAIPLYRCPGNDVCLGDPPLLCKQGNTVTLFNGGGKPKCSLKGHSLVPSSEISLYFCVVTGTPHYCGALYCNKKILNSDGANVCLLTGLVLVDRRVTEGRYGDPVPFLNYVPQDTKELTPETICNKAISFENQKFPPLHAGVQSYYARATIVVSMILSPKRFLLENEKKEFDPRVKIEKLRKQGMNDFITLFTILTNARLRENSFSIEFTEEHTTSLAPHYVQIALAMWGLLRTIVPGGQDITKKSLFNEFVAASLEIYRNGITLREPRNRYDIVLLPQDPVLSVVGISDDALKMLLGKKTGHKNFKKRVSKLQKEIVRLLQEAVTTHLISPELLRLTEAATELYRFKDSFL